MMFETKYTKLCRGCLSSDRKLTPVSAGGLNFYYFLLAEDRRLDALSVAGLDLCWECVAMLRRTQIFQARVQQAHTILENSLGIPTRTTFRPRSLLSGLIKTGKATLSSLTIQQKVEYDDIFEETETNEQPLFSETKVRNVTVDKIVIPTKYKALVTENAKIFKDESDDDSTKINYDNDEDDDSDDHENVDACDSRSSSPDITIKKITPPKKLQDVKIIKHLDLNDEKPDRAQLKTTRLIINRPVKYRKLPAPAIVKTPVIAKLELELQKLMQNAKNCAKNVTLQNRSKPKKTKKESTTSTERNAGSSNDIAEKKNITDCGQDDSESSAEDDASNQVRKETNTIRKRSKRDEDPDFSLEDDRNSDQNKSEEDDPKENLDVVDKEKIMKERRFKKTTIMRYKHINDVLSCFTEIEMSVDDLKSLLEKQDAIVDEKKPYDCSICGQRFGRRRVLTHHALGYHKATHPAQFIKGSFYSPPPTIPEKPSLWRCSVCKIMLRREHILAHMNAQHRTQYFCNGQGCEWSMKGFWIKEDFIEHWAAIHKQFVCNFCRKLTKKKSAMELHITQTHLRLPKQKCPHCSRTYVHRKALLQHVNNRHSVPEPAEHRYCVECDVTFNSISNLQKHLYNKHNEARTKYPCPDCGRVLSNKTTYQNHYSFFHTGKKDFCCHVCGKYFSKAQALEGHLKIHLNIKPPKDKPCAICGRKFQTKRILRHHMYTHTGERPHACPHCDAAYAQPYCLRMHLARRHALPAPETQQKKVPTTPTTTQHDQQTSLIEGGPGSTSDIAPAAVIP